MGKIELDHTGSGSGVTLSSDGTSLLLDGTAIGGGGGGIEVSTKTADYTLTSSDDTKIILFNSSSNRTLTFPAASSVGANYSVTVVNKGTGYVTFSQNGTETLDLVNLTNLQGYWHRLQGGSSITLFTDGSNWFSTSVSGRAGQQIGVNAKASGTYPSAFGLGATAQGQSATAIGHGAFASGNQTQALGSSANASGAAAAAVGYQSQAAGSYSISLGYARSGGSDSLAGSIANNGSSYGATGANSVALGKLAKATGTESLAIGRENIASGTRSFAVGGYNATASSTDSVAIGYQALARNDRAVAIGFSNDSAGVGSLVLGYNSTGTHDKSIVMGDGASSSAANEITLGSSSDTVRISSAYSLPTADGTSGQVLTTDGAGNISFAAASGGGGADLYAANESSPTAQPSATGGNAIAIGEAPTASGNDSFAVQGATASGNGSISIGRNVGGGNVSLSRANSTVAIMGSTTTNNHYATAIGLNSSAQLATVAGSGMGAMALGGSYASGTNSFAAAIANNSSSYGATGANSVAIGDRAKATASNSVAIGGYGSVASGASAIAFGYQAESTDQYSTALGYGSKADARYAVALGRADTHGVRYRHAYGGNRFSTTGDAQGGLFILLSDTTDATAEALTTDNGTASTYNQIVLPNNSAYFFSGTCVARESAASGTDMGAWEFKGCIRREANAGTTTLVSSTIDEFSAPTGWSVALTADTTNGGLKVEVTGAASTNIRWVATVDTSEVTYA